MHLSGYKSLRQKHPRSKNPQAHSVRPTGFQLIIHQNQFQYLNRNPNKRALPVLRVHQRVLTGLGVADK